MTGKTIEDLFADGTLWCAEIRRLREVVLSCGLQEEVKWGAPCYTRNGKNVVGIAAFKSYFGLWFYQGALLADEAGVLINAQQGKTRAMRQWRMSSAKDIKVTLLRRYLREAVKLADDGREIKAVRNKAIDVPPALAAALVKCKKMKKAFDALLPGKQREYAEYIGSAKRPETVENRLTRIRPLIEHGLGLHDNYRK